MSEGQANTDVDSLERVHTAVNQFAGDTYIFEHRSAVALSEFEEMLKEELRRINEVIDEESLRRIRRGYSELDQMLAESDGEEEKRKEYEETLRRFEALKGMMAEYEACRDEFSEQLRNLMQGETMTGDAHGLPKVIALLRDYLGLG